MSATTTRRSAGRPRKVWPRLTEEQRALVEAAMPKLSNAIKADPYFRPLVRQFDTFEDAYQAGCLGMARAATMFDPARGLDFWTYAWDWVRSQLALRAKGQSAMFLVASGRSKQAQNGRVAGFVHTLIRATLEPHPDIAGDPLATWFGAPDRRLEAAPDRELIDRGFRSCCARERFVLERWAEGLPFYRIAELLGTTRQRAHQIFQKAEAKFRRAVEWQ